MGLYGINMNSNYFKTISADELYGHKSDWQLVDIRDENAFYQGHIPGSIHLNNQNQHKYISESDFDIPLVVICYVGNSSKGAAQLLSDAGFNQVYSLNGGISFWRARYPEFIATGVNQNQWA